MEIIIILRKILLVLITKINITLKIRNNINQQSHCRTIQTSIYNYVFFLLERITSIFGFLTISPLNAKCQIDILLQKRRFSAYIDISFNECKNRSFGSYALREERVSETCRKLSRLLALYYLRSPLHCIDFAKILMYVLSF